MSTVYQYDSNGFFMGQTNDYGGPMPNNCTDVAPVLKENFIPNWAGNMWIDIENHIGKQGYLNEEAYTIDSYGPLPEGWTEEAPEE